MVLVLVPQTELAADIARDRTREFAPVDPSRVISPSRGMAGNLKTLYDQREPLNYFVSNLCTTRENIIFAEK